MPCTLAKLNQKATVHFYYNATLSPIGVTKVSCHLTVARMAEEWRRSDGGMAINSWSYDRFGCQLARTFVTPQYAKTLVFSVNSPSLDFTKPELFFMISLFCGRSEKEKFHSQWNGYPPTPKEFHTKNKEYLSFTLIHAELELGTPCPTELIKRARFARPFL